MFSSFFGGGGSSSDNAASATSSTSAPTDPAAQASKLFGSFVSGLQEFGKIVKTKVDAVTDTALGEFNHMQNDFVAQQQARKNAGASLPPWAGHPDAAALRAKILSLTADKRNFTRDPPPGAAAAVATHTATVLLEEDPALEQMRFALVPKEVSEERFWRNYFYRVSLMLEAAGVAPPASADAVPAIQPPAAAVAAVSVNPEQDKPIAAAAAAAAAPGATIDDEAANENEDAMSERSFAGDDLPADEATGNADGDDDKPVAAKAAAAVVPNAPAVVAVVAEPASPAPTTTTEGQSDWEAALQDELRDLELDPAMAVGEPDAAWEEELLDMLEAEGNGKPAA